MRYKPGFCAQCHTQIAVKDHAGRVCAILPNYRSVYIVMQNPEATHQECRMKVPVCEVCYSEGVDPEEIFDNCDKAGMEATKWHKTQKQVAIKAEKAEKSERFSDATKKKGEVEVEKK